MSELVELRALCQIQYNAWEIARRAGDTDTFKKYLALTSAPPPIDIAMDGRILDGFHRVIVAIAKGHRTIEAVRIEQRWPRKNSESGT